MRRLLNFLLVFLLLYGQAYSATTTRNPTGDDSYGGTVSGSAGTRYQSVDDYPDTGPTDYLELGTTANSFFLSTFPSFTVPVGATSITVDVLYYDAEPSSGSNTSAAHIRITSGGTRYSSGTHNPSGTTYTQRTKSWATNPGTGSAWTVDDVNGTGSGALYSFGVIGPDSNPVFRVSSTQVRVNFTPPSNNGFQTTSPTGRHGSQTGAPPSGEANAQKFTCPGSGTQEITEIGVWVAADAATTMTFKLAIFTHDAVNDNPDTMVSNSETTEMSHNTTTVTKKSYTYSGTKPQLTGGTTYWLGIIQGDNNGNIDLANGGSSLVWVGVTYPTWPTAAQWDTATGDVADIGIYAVYKSATSIKSVDGLIKASVKSVDALAIGSVKSIDGLQ